MNLIIKKLFVFIAATLSMNGNSQITLRYMNNQTPTWNEVIDMYATLDSTYSTAKLIEAGSTDAGKPLHLFIISVDKVFTPEQIHASDKRIILINNGIHPGESNGIDASLEFAEELLSGKNYLSKSLENTVILIVPVFNVGGALNRSAYYRTNQNGPEEKGFRGNARNLDLNRDFVKMDSKNTISLANIIQKWDPDILIDTHCTDGADYPYTLTLIPSHPQQLEEPQADFMQQVMEPWLYSEMNKSPYQMCHYVNVFRSSPEQGFEGFYNYLRYLPGYTSTFQILSFTIESHMLKPYKERVLSTKYLLGEFLKFTHVHASEIRDNKKAAANATINKKSYGLQWQIDSTKYDLINFNGYAARTRKSKITGQQMLYYDREDHWSDSIPFYNYYKPAIQVNAPGYYIIPGAWREVIERLKISNIEMSILRQDTSLNVEAYFIEDFKTSNQPYNGHYWHNACSVRKENIRVNLYKGDIVVPVRQKGNSYIVKTLEPQAYDSFFSWNFFDAILSRNEYFSPYLFEEIAFNVLKNNPDLEQEFNIKKAYDSVFNKNAYAQLSWIYERSPWSEPVYRRYPVYRYNGKLKN